jgi:hypothetical protein
MPVIVVHDKGGAVKYHRDFPQEYRAALACFQFRSAIQWLRPRSLTPSLVKEGKKLCQNFGVLAWIWQNTTRESEFSAGFSKTRPELRSSSRDPAKHD